ncbi:MAG: nuclear transport factor 2 family protein [Kofleriaceae bacterium]|nr:nuclear transport factor 2 family protein [Kofleriaceae bacterium]MBP6838720.1 nuclear transport factor 2 family protein [Kofleriaceae bacterium]
MPFPARSRRLAHLHQHARLVVSVVVLSAASCKGGDPKATTQPVGSGAGSSSGAVGTVGPGDGAPGAGSATAARAPAAPRASLDEAGARALVGSWLAAQNGGDFDAYATLYADRFAGIKRAGPRVSQFEREGWLRDRRTMFSKPMVVTADELQLRLGVDTAVVELTQTFSQGRFKDVGKKQLVIVATAAGARIAREEMLSSQLAGPIGGGDARWSFVLGHGGAYYAVLAQTTGARGAGAVSAIEGHDPMIVVDDVVAGSTSADEAAWVGRRVRVFDSGSQCDTTVTSLRLAYVATPHFGTVQAWKGELDDNPALSPAAQSKELTTLAAPMLIGKLDGVCAGRWVNLQGGAGSALSPTAPPPTLADKVLAQLRASAPWLALQQEASGQGEGSGSDALWHDKLDVGLWASVDGRTGTAPANPAPARARFLYVNAHGGHTCQDFDGTLAMVWVVSASGAPTALGKIGATPTDPWGEAMQVLDLDGDGKPELASDSAIFTWTGKEWQQRASLDRHYLDTPC